MNAYTITRTLCEQGGAGKQATRCDGASPPLFTHVCDPLRWCFAPFVHARVGPLFTHVSCVWRRRYVEETGPDALRKVVLIPDSHSMLIVNLLRLPSPVSNRVFATWLTWRKEPDNTFILAWAPMEDYAEEAEDAMELFVAEQEAQQKKRSLEGDMTVSMIQDSLLQDAADLKRMIKERALKKQHVKQLLALIKHHPLASQAKRGKTRGITCIRPRAAATCEMTYLVQVSTANKHTHKAHTQSTHTKHTHTKQMCMTPFSHMCMAGRTRRQHTHGAP